MTYQVLISKTPERGFKIEGKFSLLLISTYLSVSLIIYLFIYFNNSISSSSSLPASLFSVPGISSLTLFPSLPLPSHPVCHSLNPSVIYKYSQKMSEDLSDTRTQIAFGAFFGTSMDDLTRFVRQVTKLNARQLGNDFLPFARSLKQTSCILLRFQVVYIDLYV